MKKSAVKRFIVAMLSLAMAVGCLGGLTACGKKDSNAIQIWAGTYWGGDNQPVLQSMVDKWNEYAEANGKKTAVLSVQQDMRGNMTTGAISGMIGDIVIWDRWESLRLAKQEVFIPIDDRLTAAGHSVDEFNAAAMSETLYNGQHYGVPFDLDTWGLFVNRNMYLDWARGVTDADTLAWLVNEGKTDETTVGLEDSKYNYPVDWDQFYTAVRGCTVRNAQGEFERPGITVDAEFVAWVSTAGGEIADASSGQVLLHTEEKIPGDPQGRTYRQATEQVLDLLDKLILQSTDTEEEKQQAVTSFSVFSSSSTLDYFLTEKVAFKSNSILNGMTTYNKFKKDGFEFDFIPFPSAPGLNKRGGMLGGYSMAIPKRAPHVEEAWEMIEWWILNDQNYLDWTDISHLIPSRTALVVQVRNDADLMADAPYLMSAIDCLPNYRVRPPHIAYTLYETNVQSPALDVYLRRSDDRVPSVGFMRNEFFRSIENSADLNTVLGNAKPEDL